MKRLQFIQCDQSDCPNHIFNIMDRMWTNGSYKATFSLDPGSWQTVEERFGVLGKHFMSHGGGTCHMGRGLLPKECYIVHFTFRTWVWTVDLRKLSRLQSLLWQLGRNDKVNQFGSKYSRLHHAHTQCICVCCIWILCECDKNSCLKKKHSTLLSTWAHDYGSGHETGSKAYWHDNYH